ncbi:tetratricopeptide repeat protein [Acrocarpospora catenulata]|uniref:tetratricopeptide repeat protein n=1 Tax=Acrocarpospora catenulata TaxID=2836182 RepID=UPI002023A4E2|nr:tetratricopeptide repeat protein [Acrocarpospora catenulata]
MIDEEGRSPGAPALTGAVHARKDVRKPGHLWVRGSRWHEVRDLPPLLVPPIDAHRSAGPYTVARLLLGALVPRARAELVAAHDVELRAAGLGGLVPARRTSLADRVPPEQRILVPGARRTLRLANGMTEFVRDHVTGPAALVVENLHEADHTDREFVGVLLRRIDPARLTVVACAADLEPPGQVEVLAGVVESGAYSWPEPTVELVRSYVEQGFHHAAAEAGRWALDRAVVDSPPWWALIQRTAGALAAIDREDEARDLYDLARRESTEPVNRATAAYATAMILTRHHDPERRDLDEARSWINEAVTITRLLPDRRQRAFHLGFDLNGKALIETRRRRPEAALRLVEEAIELADRDLAPDEHPIHRLVLRANRAQLRAALGDPAAALTDLNTVIEADPGYPDYYIDRGNLLYRLGRPDEAVADYETAMRVGPPFPEAYYNRAEVRFALGDHEGALADLDYAIELDPEFVDAYANRAGLLVATGAYERAKADARRGLALQPRNAYLLCALGQAEAATGEPAAARKAYDAALIHDPELAAAWASRGELAFALGDPRGAVADLTRAIELGDDAALRFNRAMALRALGEAERARVDLTRAAELDPGDEDVRNALSS